jgi:cytosine deaminase
MPSSDPFLAAAVDEARLGLAEGGIPVGSVLVHQGKIIGRGRNRRFQDGSVIHHGEMNCLENAGPLPASVYRECTLYTTLSPCTMCSGTILLFEIPHVVVGENSNCQGLEDVLRARGVRMDIVNDPECLELMKAFEAIPRDKPCNADTFWL